MLVARMTFRILLFGGIGSKTLCWADWGKAAKRGSTESFGSSGLRLSAYSLTRSSNDSMVSWPVRKTRMSPGSGSL